ncbi:MAG: hypothetical protein FJ257_10100 [Phycisphaerae bacterium]|nr:hypothetical protein [Phycisphaerae bacterium]
MTPREESCRRFLGCAVGADPREVLGIEGGALTVARVEQATRRRWRQVQSHPAAGDPSAQHARAAILDAAERLLHRPPATTTLPPASRWELVDAGLAEAIRSSGGLNHETSLRLAAVARSNRLSPEALLARLRTIVSSGSLRVRRRHPPRWRTARRLVRRGSGVEGELARLLDELERIVDSDPPAPSLEGGRRRALPIALGAVLLLGLLGAAFWLLRPAPDALEEVPAGVDERFADDVELPADAPSLEPARSAAPATVVARHQVNAVPPWTPESLLEPVIDGDLGVRVAAALIDVGATAPRLRDLAERIRGEKGIPSETSLASWREIQQAPGRCWPRMPVARRREILAATAECFAAVETITAGEALMEGLGPIEPTTARGLGIWGSAWSAAVLADVARRGGLVSTVRDRLRRRLDELPLPARRGWAAPSPFEETAARVLGAWVGREGEDPIAEDSVGSWRSWFEATGSLDPRGLRAAADLEAVRALLEGWRPGEDLDRRLVLLSTVVRRLDPARDVLAAPLPEVLSSLMRPGAALPDADATWKVASVLLEVPGLGEVAGGRVPGPASSGPDRVAWLESMRGTWPVVEPPPSSIDPEARRRTAELLEILRQRPRGSVLGTMALLVEAGRLHQAILGAAGGETPSRAALESIERALTERGAPPPDPPRAARRPPVSDGAFADGMKAAISDREARIDLVRGLRDRGGVDLGEQDARAFARALLKDAPEVRQAAAAVFIETQAESTPVLEQLLDLSVGLERDLILIATLRRASGRALPPPNDESAPREVRRAILDMLLASLPSESRRLDALAAQHAASVAARQKLLLPGTEPPTAPTDPVAALGSLVDRLMREAIDLPLGDAPLSTERIATRRRLRLAAAEGASQRLVGELATLAELRALAIVGGDATLADRTWAILAEAEERRQRAESSLEQAVDLEALLCELELLAARKGGAT